MPELIIQDRWLWVIDDRLAPTLWGGEVEARPAATSPAEATPSAPPVPAASAEPVLALPQEDTRAQTLWKSALLHAQARDFEAALGNYREFLDIDPKHAQATYNMAVCLFELGRYNESRQAFEAALELERGFTDARSGLAWCLLHLRQGAAALAIFEKRLEEAPGDAGAKSGRAQALHLLCRFPEACAAYQEILDLDPVNADVLANLIAVAAEQQDSANLRLHAENLLRVRPGSRQALAGLVTAEFADRDYEAAAARLPGFLDVEPNSYEAWFDAGLAGEKLDRLAQAEKAYRKAVELNRNRPEAGLNLGAVLLREGDIEAARGVFESALELEPNHAGLLWNLGLVHERLEDFQQAGSYFSRAYAADPERDEALLHSGYASLRGKDWDQAIAVFQQCIAKRRGWLEAWVHLGLAHWNAGDAEAAKLDFDEALQNDPIYVPALQCRTALALAAGDLRTASDLEGQLADLGHAVPELSYNLGCLQYALRLYEVAAQSFRRAIVKNPDFADALVNLGHALAALGRRDEAIEIWRNALSISPELATEYFDQHELTAASVPA